MNQTIIQEHSGLNQFYAKVYAFVGNWDCLICSCFSLDVNNLPRPSRTVNVKCTHMANRDRSS